MIYDIMNTVQLACPGDVGVTASFTALQSST